MAQTNLFSSALQTWFTNHDTISARQIEQESGVKNLAQFRKGSRPVTLDAMTKLLPTIERHSTRAAAITLLIAYLTDETPPSHQNTIRIEPVDTTGQTTADEYRALADRWERKARIESDFMAMWQGMDAYMFTPETILDVRTKPESDIALLSEQHVAYKVTKKTGGGSGHFHDTIRHDAMPSQHAAQEHHEP